MVVPTYATHHNNNKYIFINTEEDESFWMNTKILLIKHKDSSSQPDIFSIFGSLNNLHFPCSVFIKVLLFTNIELYTIQF